MPSAKISGAVAVVFHVARSMGVLCIARQMGENAALSGLLGRWRHRRIWPAHGIAYQSRHAFDRINATRHDRTGPTRHPLRRRACHAL